MASTTPKIFVSATYQDLKAHVEVVIREINAAGCSPIHFKLWAPNGKYSVEECCERVLECDALIVLVSDRYGWIPKAAESGNGQWAKKLVDGIRSVTRIEVQQARDHGKKVIPFVVSEEANWPRKHLEVLKNPAVGPHLEAFKKELGPRFGGWFNEDHESLAKPVFQALTELKSRLVVPVPAHATVAAAGAPSEDEALRSYLQSVTATHGSVDFGGIGENLQVRVPIGEIFVPLRLAQRHRAAGVEDAKLLKGAKAKEGAELHEGLNELPIEKLLKHMRGSDCRGVVILGEPGSGKSTAAQRLAWQCADAVQGPVTLGLPGDVVPVFLRGRDLTAAALAKGLDGFLAEGEDIGKQPNLGLRLWNRRRLLWFIDGLDEVADLKARATVVGWIRKALDERKEDRFVVTCRFAGYEQKEESEDKETESKEPPLGDGFLEVEARPFTDEQQRAYVINWYRAVERNQRHDAGDAATTATTRAKQLADILAGADFRTAKLASMAANPLLLRILCVIHREKLDLPRRRGDLYDRCIEVVLKHWRAEWSRKLGRKSFDSTAARHVLEAIAWQMHQTLGRRDATPRELEATIADALNLLGKADELAATPAEFLRRVRDESGLLVPRQAGSLAFLHLTFQEFLAAEHAHRNGLAGELAGHFAEEWWQEVALLALSRGSRSFTADYFSHVLREQAIEKHDAFAALAIDEALLLPTAPFCAALRDPKAATERKLAILRLLKGRKDAGLVKAAQELAARAGGDIAAAAAEFLHAAGRVLAETAGQPTPAVARASVTLDPGAVVLVEPGIELLLIPAGKFRMGSTSGFQDEIPVHKVTLKQPFLLARTPVTNAHYGRFLEANPQHRKPEYWTDRRFNQPNQPVVGISWDDAMAFCKWAKLMLPTEAQWEYACRAGTTTEYWKGDDETALKEVGWYDGNSEGRLHAVAEKPASPWGLHDVHGNVWEWCLDGKRNYSTEIQVDPRGPEGPGTRIFRGGSWDSPAGYARAGCRYGRAPGYRDSYLGFRPAKLVTD